MKAILISIKPKYVARILNGEKTIEIRKTMPKCDLPIDVYIYCTKDKDNLYRHFKGEFHILKEYRKECLWNGYVVAKFTLKKVEEIICRPICGEWECYTKSLGYSEISQASCLKNREIVSYLKGKIGYAWFIDNLVIFDKPKELGEFKIKGFERIKVMGSPYGDLLGSVAYHYEKKPILKPLTKAPQSWCYVEVE